MAYCPAHALVGRQQGPVFMVGRLPKWPTGADCKSAGLRLRWFESITYHQPSLGAQRRAKAVAPERSEGAAESGIAITSASGFGQASQPSDAGSGSTVFMLKILGRKAALAADYAERYGLSLVY